MRLSSPLLMLTSLIRAGRSVIPAFCSANSVPTSPSALPTLAMSSSSSKLQEVAGDGIGGDGITLVPKGGEYKNVVVWLHGLGDTADGWASSMPQLGLKDTKFILPTAGGRPITLNGGFRMPGWSDIIGLSDDAPEDAEGFGESAKRVWSILDAEREKGKEDGRMVVGGFSQGGAVALHVCLRSARKLAGCVACSSWVPLNKDFPASLGSAAKDIPVSQFHGTRDEVVRFSWGQRSYNMMKNDLGITVDFQPLLGMGHSASAEELEAVGDFLRKVLSE